VLLLGAETMTTTIYALIAVSVVFNIYLVVIVDRLNRDVRELMK